MLYYAISSFFSAAKQRVKDPKVMNQSLSWKPRRERKRDSKLLLYAIFLSFLSSQEKGIEERSKTTVSLETQ